MSHQQAGVQPSPGNQDSVTPNGYLGRQTLSLQVSPLRPPFPSAFIAENNILGSGASLGSAVLAMSPPSFLCTPSLIAGRAVEGGEKALVCVSTPQQ